MPSSVPNFNFSTVFVSEIKRGSQNFMWYCWPPAVPRTLILLCVLQVLGKIKRPAKFLHRSSMHRVVMWIRICHRLSIICTQKLCFGGFLGWKCQNTVFWPQKRPAWLRVSWHIACQNRFNELVQCNIFMNYTCSQTIFLKWVVHIPKHFAIWYSWSISESPGNSGSPVSNSAVKQPTAHTSTALLHTNINIVMWH